MVGAIVKGFLILLAMSTVFCQYSWSDSGDEPSESELQLLRNKYGLDLNDPNVKQMFSGERSAGFGDRGRDKPVLKYIRGEKGVPFPDPAEQPAPTVALDNVKAKVIERAEAERQEAEKLLSAVPKLEQCPESRTLVSKNEKTGKKAKIDIEETFEDLLFVAPEDLPSDPAEAFGRKVAIFVYDNEPGPDTNMARGLQVNCLPTRLRQTARAFYRQEGLDALLNYDEKPDGDGKLHPLVEHLVRKFD